MADVAIAPAGAKLPAPVEQLVDAIGADGGAALAAFQEPVGGHWHVFAIEMKGDNVTVQPPAEFAEILRRLGATGETDGENDPRVDS